MVNIAWDQILPVIVSILIIIAVAILRYYSPAFAAIAAVMPLNIPLGMWIIYSAAGEQTDKQKILADFNEALLLNIIPTLLFMIVAWQMTKARYELIPTILTSYTVWAIGLGLIFGLRSWWGG